jgi:multidrug resistance efflux pump
MIGEVESIQTFVRAPNAGQVTNLMVRQYQLVKKDQPIAEFVSADFRAVTSQVQDLRSRIAMESLQVTAILDRDRLGYHFQSMAMETLRVRADLASSEAELPLAEAAFERAERGFKEQVVPYNDYEVALRTRDSLRAKIVELKRLVKDAEAHLAEAAKNVGSYKEEGSMGKLSEALQTLTDTRVELDKQRSVPVVLRAPMDGVVAEILHRDGENVQPGDVIVTIHAVEPSRIVTYIRQGMIPHPLKRGEEVTVRCRSRSREQAVSRIEDIGFRYEPITNHALMRPGVPFELGMPVGVSIPASLRPILKPGEVVDLAIGQ